MDMGIQKTGKDDLSGHIHFLGSAVLAHAYDQPLRHGDVGGAKLVGEHIHVRGIFQNQIRRFPTGGRVDDAPLFQQLPVDPAGYRCISDSFQAYRSGYCTGKCQGIM